MNTKGLKIKDLVTIGVFAVIYFALMFAIGMMGLIPILFLVYPTILGILTGTVIMLFMAKVEKPWGLFILGMLSPLVMFAAGHTVVLPALAFVSVFIAEMVRRAGKFTSVKYNIAAFAFFNTWICASLMQMLLAKEKYLEMSKMMRKEYLDALEKLITYPHMAMVYSGALIGGLIGGIIGNKLLKKHFKKAGIV